MQLKWFISVPNQFPLHVNVNCIIQMFKMCNLCKNNKSILNFVFLLIHLFLYQCQPLIGRLIRSSYSLGKAANERSCYPGSRKRQPIGSDILQMHLLGKKSWMHWAFVIRSQLFKETINEDLRCRIRFR